MKLSRPRFTVRRLIIAVAVVGLTLVGVTFWFIIPAWDQWETSKSYRAKSEWFDFRAGLTREFAKNFVQVKNQSEEINKIGEQEFKSFVRDTYPLRILAYSNDLFEMARATEDAEQACENAWLKYDKLSDKERIEWWENERKGWQRISDHLSRMKLKYEIAADRPWLPVPPDPPPPK
jgi:hypothetical protein